MERKRLGLFDTFAFIIFFNSYYSGRLLIYAKEHSCLDPTMTADMAF